MSGRDGILTETLAYAKKAELGLSIVFFIAISLRFERLERVVCVIFRKLIDAAHAVKRTVNNGRTVIGGDIAYLGLNEFWMSCTPLEQQDVIRYTRSFLGASPDASPIAGEPACNLSKLSFLSSYIMWAANERNYVLTDKLIFWCEKYYDEERDYLRKHFYLYTIAEYYYKLRDIRPDALQKVEVYCLKDIALYPKYIPLLEEQSQAQAKPYIMAFKRLAIMYEKSSRYEDAIEICRQAMKHGLTDGTKSGYSGRISRLENKMKSNKA